MKIAKAQAQAWSGDSTIVSAMIKTGIVMPLKNASIKCVVSAVKWKWSSFISWNKIHFEYIWYDQMLLLYLFWRMLAWLTTKYKFLLEIHANSIKLNLSCGIELGPLIVMTVGTHFFKWNYGFNLCALLPSSDLCMVHTRVLFKAHSDSPYNWYVWTFNWQNDDRIWKTKSNCLSERNNATDLNGHVLELRWISSWIG